MVATDLLAFVRANLPAPPLRLLEIGAGDGVLARSLAGAGYEVLAIDPEPAGADVRPVGAVRAGRTIRALRRGGRDHLAPPRRAARGLTQAPRAAAGAGRRAGRGRVRCRRLRRARGAWWLRQRHALGAAEHASAEELVGENIARTCTRSSGSSQQPHFHVGTPLYGPYLYRWDLDEALRSQEEDAIARAEIPAVGARLLALRNA
jgi:hypothetical protein